MQVYNTQNIIPASTVMNTTLNSQAMQLLNMFGFNIQIVFTGTPTGTFKLQASSDPIYKGAPGHQFTPTNWTDVVNSSQAVTAAGNISWNYSGSYFNYVRVVYTDTSSGSSTAIITVATFNGKGS